MALHGLGRGTAVCGRERTREGYVHGISYGKGIPTGQKHVDPLYVVALHGHGRGTAVPLWQGTSKTGYSSTVGESREVRVVEEHEEQRGMPHDIDFADILT